MRKLSLRLLTLVALGAQAPAQTLTTMFHFNGEDGAGVIWKPVVDGQGNMYGTTEYGGPTSSGNTVGSGTIYEFTPGARTFITVHNFAGGTDGVEPRAGLTYDKSSGTLYGTTQYGGAITAACQNYGCGTIFSVNSATGAYATLYSFTGGADEGYPQGAMVLGSDGALYGTATGNTQGPGCVRLNECGTVFKYDPGTGTFMTLHVFSHTDGNSPVALALSQSGTLFGVTEYGGNVTKNYHPGYGVVFSIDPVSLAFTIIYKFPTSSIPLPDGVAVDHANNLYVTTEFGGANGYGAITKLVPNGDGTYSVSTLFSFDSSGPNGFGPLGSVSVDSNRNYLYGTTVAGGAYNYGTVYQLDPDSGAFTLLYSFTGGLDGGKPQDGIRIHLGQLYGATNHYTPAHNPPPQCSQWGCGTLFKYPRF